MVYTQRNDGIVWFFAAFLTVALLLVWLSGPMGDTLLVPMLPMLFLLGLVATVMSRLSVAVTGEVLSVWLGPGLMRQHYRRADVVEVKEIPAPSPFAVGVRWLGDGWLYSLGSPNGVQARFADGTRLVIGAGQNGDLADELRRWVRF